MSVAAVLAPPPSSCTGLLGSLALRQPASHDGCQYAVDVLVHVIMHGARPSSMPRSCMRRHSLLYATYSTFSDPALRERPR